VESLIRQIESAGLAYVQPPYFETYDRAGLGRIVERLTNVCRREFGLITVGPPQSVQARRTGRTGMAEDAVEPIDRTVESPTELAHRITASYTAGDRRSVSFLLDPASGRFISPHVYLAAREYLRRPPLTEFRLGIIGGCSSHQRDTPLNALYHRQLAQLLAANPGVRLRTRIVRAFSRPYTERLDQLLAGPPIDSVMLHIRVSTVMQSRLLMTRYEHGRPRLAFNPALFRRGHSPRSGATPTGALHEPDAYGDEPFYDQDLPRPGRRIAGFRLRNLTHLLGALAGLDRWAIEEDMLGLDAIVRACEDRGVPLIVLGPTPASYSYWSQRVVRRTNAAIRRRLTGTGIPFALIDCVRDADGHPLTLADGVHMTPAGHRYTAERLYEAGVRELAGHQGALVD
jgi:hypothetical protein